MVHLFKRLYPETTITTTANTDFIQTYTVQLSELPGYTEFSALYRQYRINGLKLRVIPQYANLAGAGTSTFNGFQWRAFSALNYDEVYSNANGQTIPDVRQLQGCRIHTNIGRGFTRYCPKPTWNTTISNVVDTPAISGTRPSRGWLDIDYADVQHYGITLAFENPVSAVQEYRIECVAYLAFKGYR